MKNKTSDITTTFYLEKLQIIYYITYNSFFIKKNHSNF